MAFRGLTAEEIDEALDDDGIPLVESDDEDQTLDRQPVFENLEPAEMDSILHLDAELAADGADEELQNLEENEGRKSDFNYGLFIVYFYT